MGYFTNYPKHVFCILANEFCERFSYYGLRAILVIYLWKAIGLDQSTATAVYHSFIVVSYFTPLFGAIIADGWIGKCKTILSISVLYVLGTIVLSVTAIPINGTYYIYGPVIGLVMIALGTGGIKPCVSSFGGDQFTDDQRRQKESFFSVFYMSINIGSLLSTIITPSIRGGVYCFNTSCYALAFGIPAILMVVAFIVFAAGIPWYRKVPPGQSIVTRFAGCVGKALVRSCRCHGKRRSSDAEKKEHWLDYAEPDYDRQFISDVKDVLGVMWIFLPLPVFWALYDQQGSRWTLQATQMNGNVGSIVIQPDLIQVLNPILIVIMVPLLESLIYPCFDKIRAPLKPLRRMSIGMLLAAASFVVAAGIQVVIDKDLPTAIAVGQAKVRFINTAPCDIFINIHNDPTTDAIQVTTFNSSDYMYVGSGNRSLSVTWSDCDGERNKTFDSLLLLDEKKAYHIYIGNDFKIHQFEQTIQTQTDDLGSTVRFYNSLDLEIASLSLLAAGGEEQEPHDLGRIAARSPSAYEPIMLANFYVDVRLSENGTSRRLGAEVQSANGAVYTVIIRNRTDATPSDVIDGLSLDIVQLADIEPWSTSILLQIPQYFVISLGECLFSVTGLAFAYTQAPVSMKSFLSSIWLLTDAIGNVVVIIVAESGSSMRQVYEFLLFAGIMFVTTLIFIGMAIRYTYAEPRNADDDYDAAAMEQHKTNGTAAAAAGVKDKDEKATARHVSHQGGDEFTKL